MTRLKLKRMLSLILTMSIMLTTLSGLSVQVTAAEKNDSACEIVDTGTCGDTLTWTLYDDGTLIVSGTGIMYDYVSGSAPWYSYRELIQRIVIEDEVYNIGECAFDYCFAVTEVIIGNSVENIGAWSFSACFNLKQITIGENVKTIRRFAFYYCEELTSVKLPDGLTDIEGGAFTQCKNLASVYLGKNIVNIGDYAFQLCYGLDHLLYAGTEEQWSDVNLQEGNELLLDSIWHYECGRDDLKIIVGCEFYRTECDICDKVLIASRRWNGSIPDGIHAFSEGVCIYCGISKDIAGYSITDDEGNWGCTIGKSLIITAFNNDVVIVEVPETIEGLPVQRIHSEAFHSAWSAEHVFFWGDAPIIEDSTFEGETLTCYYPKNNNTWTEEVLRDYGGNITWIEHSGEIPTVITRQPWSEQRLYGATIKLSTGTNKNNVSYQWQYRTPTGNWEDATDSGSTTEAVKILFVKGMDGYQYRCAITDEIGKIIYSDVAELQLLEATELQLGVTIPRPDDFAYGAPRYFYFTPEITDAYALIGSGVDYFYDLYDIDMQYIEWNEDDTYVLEAGNTYIFETGSAVQTSGVMTLVTVHNYTCEEVQSSCAEGGVNTYVCTYCNDSYTQLADHTFENCICTTCNILEQNIASAYLLLKYIDGHDAGLTDEQADINGDGKVTLFDAVRFLQLLNTTTIE